jgi:hypothetical protein
MGDEAEKRRRCDEDEDEKKIRHRGPVLLASGRARPAISLATSEEPSVETSVETVGQ